MKPTRYHEILQRAEAELSTEEQCQLVDELSRHVARKNGATHRITDLKGLGKDLWRGVNTEAYVAEERDAWDG
jgi:hypothetical protein